MLSRKGVWRVDRRLSDGLTRWPLRLDRRGRSLTPVSKTPGGPLDAAGFWWAMRMVSEEGISLRFPPWFVPESVCLPLSELRRALDCVLLGPHAGKALEAMNRLDLLSQVIPEFGECNVPQGSRHRYTVPLHSIKTVAAIKPQLVLRLAALLHDVGKGRTYQPGPDRPRFPRHEVEGAFMAEIRLTALGYEDGLVERVRKLIRWHMFSAGSFSTVESLERFVRRVGPETVLDLLELRRADIVASGGPITVDTLSGLQTLARRLQGLLAGTPDLDD